MTRTLVFLVLCALAAAVQARSLRGSSVHSALSSAARDTLRVAALGPGVTARDHSDVFSGKLGVLTQGVADDDDNSVPLAPGVPSPPSGGAETHAPPSHSGAPMPPAPSSGDETPEAPAHSIGDVTPDAPSQHGGDETPEQDGEVPPAKPPVAPHKPSPPVAKPTSFSTADDDKVAVTNDPMPSAPGSSSGSESGSHSTGESSSSSSSGVRSYSTLEICALVTILAAMVATLVAVPVCVWKCHASRSAFNFSGPLPDTTSRPMPAAAAGGYASALQFSESGGLGMDASNAALMSAPTPASSPAKGAVVSPLMAAAAHHALSQTEPSAPDLESGGKASSDLAWRLAQLHAEAAAASASAPAPAPATATDASPVPPPPAPMGVESTSGKGFRGTTPRMV